MYAVGVVEIIAGLIVALHPRLGAPIVAAWLIGIIVNLLLIGGFYDVALRDFGLFLAAIALSRLASTYDPRPLLWVTRGQRLSPQASPAKPAAHVGDRAANES